MTCVCIYVCLSDWLFIISLFIAHSCMCGLQLNKFNLITDECLVHVFRA